VVHPFAQRPPLCIELVPQRHVGLCLAMMNQASLARRWTWGLAHVEASDEWYGQLAATCRQTATATAAASRCLRMHQLAHETESSACAVPDGSRQAGDYATWCCRPENVAKLASARLLHLPLLRIVAADPHALRWSGVKQDIAAMISRELGSHTPGQDRQRATVLEVLCVLLLLNSDGTSVSPLSELLTELIMEAPQTRDGNDALALVHPALLEELALLTCAHK
jgi:hypothetical protein